MIEALKSRLNEKRFLHSLGVANLSKTLAEQYGEVPEKAYIAGLLHDCAKNISVSDSIKMCEEFKIVPDSIELKNSALIHAPLGAEIAMRDFDVKDSDIYNAIKYHTVGRAGMSTLEKIVYVADMAEETRCFDGVDDIRELLKVDLDEAVLAAIRFSVGFTLKQGKLLHPNTIVAWNDIKIKKEAKWMNSLEKAKIIAKAIDDKKAKTVEILDVTKQTSLCEYFVIGSCQSTTQVKACADWAEEKLKEAGKSVHHIEGYAGGNWILLDFGDVVVHVMTDETRDFYNMERLWEDAVSVPVEFE